jgi:parvulin-like peptidyl-prolyl isomerase
MSVYSLRLWNETSPLDVLVDDLAGTPFYAHFMQDMLRVLILRRAVREHAVELHVDEALKNTLLKQFGARRGLVDSVSIQRWLRENHTTLEALMEKLLHEERIERLKAILVPEDKIKERFLARKSRLDQVVFAIIRLEKESAAREIYYRLTHDSQDFAEMARRFSIGPEAKQGGIRGPLPVRELNPELKRRLLALKPQEIGEPFRLQDLHFIVRLIRLDPAQLTDELTQTLRDELFEDWMDRQVLLADPQLFRQEELGSGSGSPPTLTLPLKGGGDSRFPIREEAAAH